MEIVKNKNVKKSPAEKRRETILKKRQMKEQRKEAYHAKRQDKYILQAGEAYHTEKNKISDKFKKKPKQPEKSYYVTATFEIRTMWYKNDSTSEIDDASAAILTDLYLNKYNSEVFSLFKDPFVDIHNAIDQVKCHRLYL